MKTCGHHIKAILSLLLLVIYLFVVSAYVVFHPRNGLANVKSVTGNHADYLHRGNDSNNIYTQLHGAFKTVIENKRKAATFLIKAATLAFVLIVSRFYLPVTIRTIASFNNLSYPHQYSYLSLRSLRI